MRARRMTPVEVITMKIDTLSLFQHVSAVLILAICMLYLSLYHYSYLKGFPPLMASLILLYSYNAVKIQQLPEEDIRARRELSSFLSWFLALSFLGLEIDNNSLLIVSVIPLFMVFAVGFSYYRKFSREDSHLGFVLRGELEYLEEIKAYLMRAVNENRVELIEPAFSKQSLCVVKESEWCTYAEFKEGGLLPSDLKKEEPDSTFSGILCGKYRTLEAIRQQISDQYITDGPIKIFRFAYSRSRLYIVPELEWKECNRISAKPT